MEPLFMDTAETVFRDFETDGVPSSGPHKPLKRDIRALITYLEAGVLGGAAGSAVFASKATMDATLTYPANTMAWVIGDATAANNGIYQKSGGTGTGSWVRRGDLPYSFIKATDAGAGTANAIVATTSTPIPAADGAALVALNIFEANTASPVTVAFNGGSALTIKTNSGNDVAAGGLAAGAIVTGYVSGSTFRLLSDQASAAIVADAEAVLEEIRDLYLGTFADDAAATVAAGTPTEGQLYFRTSDSSLRVYTGGAWASAEGDTGPQGIQGIQGIQGERDTRNFIWGGSFDWWRRGTSIAGTAARIGTADGWTIARTSGVTGVTVSQQQGSRGTNLCMRVHRTAGDAQTNAIQTVFNLGLDDTRPLAGKAAILTFRARAGANYSATSMALTVAVKSSNSLIEQAINLTNGNYSTGDNTTASAAVTLTTSWQTFTVPAWTYASDVAQTAVRFQEVPTGTAGAADWFEIEEIQLELGTVASTFVPIDPAYSLMKAEQQYLKSYNPDVAPGTAPNYGGSLGNLAVGTGVAAGVFMEAQFSAMRAAPTVTLYSPQTGAAGVMARGSLADIAATATHIGRSGFRIWNNAATIAGSDYYVHYTADARL
jgi:hypothetical protein